MHVTTGQWIWQHGSVPTTGPFSYVTAGHAFVAHSWLSEVLFYGLERRRGDRRISGPAVCPGRGKSHDHSARRTASERFLARDLEYPRIMSTDLAGVCGKDLERCAAGAPESAPLNRWSTAALMSLCLVTMARASRRSTCWPLTPSTGRLHRGPSRYGRESVLSLRPPPGAR